MIGPKISHDPGFKMGRDSVLNPPESSFSHELPDNDKQIFAQQVGTSIPSPSLSAENEKQRTIYLNNF
jgi:hypothetical protein